MADSRSWVNAPTVTPVLTILKELSGEARVATTSAVVMGRERGPAPRPGWPQARSCFGSTQVTVQVAETSRSPRMSCMLTAEPGTSAGGTGASGLGFEAAGADEAWPEGAEPEDRPEVDGPESEPPAATGSREVPAVCCCQKRMASGRNPLITSGVSIGWKFMSPGASGFRLAAVLEASSDEFRAGGAGGVVCDSAMERSGAGMSRTS